MTPRAIKPSPTSVGESGYRVAVTTEVITAGATLATIAIPAPMATGISERMAMAETIPTETEARDTIFPRDPLIQDESVENGMEKVASVPATTAPAC